MQVDERTNYSAIWVFTPRERTLQVFKQFEVTEGLHAAKRSRTAAITLVEPSKGHKTVARTVQLNPVPGHDDNEELGEDEEEEEQDEDSGAAAEHKPGTVRSSTDGDAATSQCAENVSTDVAHRQVCCRVDHAY